MIKMLYMYLHILQADSTENWNAFYKLIGLDNYKISKKSQKSVLRYIENITGSVGNFVKCICQLEVQDTLRINGQSTIVFLISDTYCTIRMILP